MIIWVIERIESEDVKVGLLCYDYYYPCSYIYIVSITVMILLLLLILFLLLVIDYISWLLLF